MVALVSAKEDSICSLISLISKHHFSNRNAFYMSEKSLAIRSDTKLIFSRLFLNSQVLHPPFLQKLQMDLWLTLRHHQKLEARYLRENIGRGFLSCPALEIGALGQSLTGFHQTPSP